MQLAISWKRKALLEGVFTTLFTALLTSAVVAAPEFFRQAPSTSWHQFTSPALAQGPVQGELVHCP